MAVGLSAKHKINQWDWDDTCRSNLCICGTVWSWRIICTLSSHFICSHLFYHSAQHVQM